MYSAVCRFLEEAWQLGREDWTHEMDTACKYGSLDVLIFLRDKTKHKPNALV